MDHIYDFDINKAKRYLDHNEIYLLLLGEIKTQRHGYYHLREKKLNVSSISQTSVVINYNHR